MTRRDFCKRSIVAGAALGATMIDPAPASAGIFNKKNTEPGGNARRVLIIAFDGIRVDAFHQADIPNVKSLVASGSASFATRDVMPSVTLPNFTSHLTGAGPEVHGVADNSWTKDNFSLPAVCLDEDGYFPSVFKVLKDGVPGIKTGFFWNWKPLIRPYNPSAFDDTLYAGNYGFAPLCDRAFDFMLGHKDEPTFAFLYTVHTDHAGHVHKWMSPEYMKAIEDGDVEVGRLIAKMKDAGIFEDTHILFISDHGGVGNGHGGVSKEEMIVPWVISGPGIKKGFIIEEANNTVNTAATVLQLFGVEKPLCWTGEVPFSVFSGKKR